MNTKNIILALILVSMGITDSAMAAMWPSNEEIRETNSVFKTFKKDMKCLFSRTKTCTREQKKRIIATGVALVAIVSSGTFAWWLVSKKKPLGKEGVERDESGVGGGAKKPAKEKEKNVGATNTLLSLLFQDNVTEAEVKRLLDQGADINFRDKDSFSLLTNAARRGDTRLMERLIGLGAVVDIRDRYGRTPLFYATRWGRKEAVELLLDKGANVHAKDKDGKMALSEAEAKDPSISKERRQEIAPILRKKMAEQ